MPGAPIVYVLGEEDHLRRGDAKRLCQALRTARTFRSLVFHSSVPLLEKIDQANAVVIFGDGRYFTQSYRLVYERCPKLPVLLVSATAGQAPECVWTVSRCIRSTSLMDLVHRMLQEGVSD